MSGTLYVVATPIGNLEDITLRALRILREATLIAAEDTRRTARLLHHHGIATPTLSFHEHNARSRVPQLLSRLRHEESIALVSDAGTPGISDPGLQLVQACIAADIVVDPLPGASAVLVALVASGFPTEPVTFLGFAPSKANSRKQWLETLATIQHTAVFFEAPHRIRTLLVEAADVLGERPLCLARELTKAHQEFSRGTAADLAYRPITARGEFTIVVGPQLQTVEPEENIPDLEVIESELRQMTDGGRLSRRQAITALSRKYGRPSRELYARLAADRRGLS